MRLRWLKRATFVLRCSPYLSRQAHESKILWRIGQKLRKLKTGFCEEGPTSVAAGVVYCDLLLERANRQGDDPDRVVRRRWGEARRAVTFKDGTALVAISAIAGMTPAAAALRNRTSRSFRCVRLTELAGVPGRVLGKSFLSKSVMAASLQRRWKCSIAANAPDS